MSCSRTTRSYSRSRHAVVGPERDLREQLPARRRRRAARPAVVVDVDSGGRQRAAQQGEVADAATPVEHRHPLARSARAVTTRRRKPGSGSGRRGSAAHGTAAEVGTASGPGRIPRPGSRQLARGTRRPRSRRPSRGCRRRRGPSPPGRTPIRALPRGARAPHPASPRDEDRRGHRLDDGFACSRRPWGCARGYGSPPAGRRSRLTATQPAKFKHRQKHSTSSNPARRNRSSFQAAATGPGRPPG